MLFHGFRDTFKIDFPMAYGRTDATRSTQSMLHGSGVYSTSRRGLDSFVMHGRRPRKAVTVFCRPNPAGLLSVLPAKRKKEATATKYENGR